MEISSDLLQKYNVPVPRYTSYPPANYFRENFPEKDYIRQIELSNQDKPELISIYIHIPFCNKICFYCGCNAVSKGSGSLVKPYIGALKKEMELVFSHLDHNRFISQIHYGGGTPNVLEAGVLKELNDYIMDNFRTIDSPEIAIESHPAYLSYDYIDGLKSAGFNRFSIGIQDLNEDILKLVNRDAAQLPVDELIRTLKKDKPEISVNLDFIYGLPGQDVRSFVETISAAASLKPDRLVTFSYAHVPWLMKHQQILEKRGLPSSEAKMQMFMAANQILTQAGYSRLGLDHFVLPDDELNAAYRLHHLHRNFQGYCTRRTTGQVYAFGVSGISQLEKGYFQNTKDIAAYIKSIENGSLPVSKGYILNDNERITGKIIEELMCNEKLIWQDLSDRLQSPADQLKQQVNLSVENLGVFIKDGLLIQTPEKIEITEKGTFFIRNIVASLDKSLNIQGNTYSKSV